MQAGGWHDRAALAARHALGAGLAQPLGRGAILPPIGHEARAPMAIVGEWVQTETPRAVMVALAPIFAAPVAHDIPAGGISRERRGHAARRWRGPSARPVRRRRSSGPAQARCNTVEECAMRVMILSFAAAAMILARALHGRHAPKRLGGAP